jgi:undecaprenyl-phosphate 4-deoxy-4-formamido-L-arabinose transferase
MTKSVSSLFRNFGSAFNDRVATLLLNKPADLYLSSFKTIDRALVKIIIQYRGPYPYIDGIILRSTQRIGTQRCQHVERTVGKSGYTLRKLIRLWLNMFTGFSILPLRITSYLGILISFVALLLTVFFVLERLFAPVFWSHTPIPTGWASTMRGDHLPGRLATQHVGHDWGILGAVVPYRQRYASISHPHHLWH